METNVINNKENTRNMQRPVGKLAIGGSIIAGIFRFLPFAANFTPVGAMAIYSGARIRGIYAFLVPLAIMLVSDAILGQIYGYGFFHAAMPFVYGAFAINILLGKYLLQKTEKMLPVIGVALLGSVQFFLITNFGSWLTSPMYPLNAGGLMAAYVAGIPFLQNSVLANVLFSSALFSAHSVLARRYFPAERLQLQTQN